MKKIVACLLAGVLSASVIALSACDNGGNSDDGEYKYPAIPNGVALNDVKVTDAIDKEAELRQKRNASNSVIQDEYTYVREIDYNKDGKASKINESEVYKNIKYLNKDGKVYGENYQSHSAYLKENYVNEDNSEVNSEQRRKTDFRTFIQDGLIGSLCKGNYYTNDSSGESEEDVPLYLYSYAANGVNGLPEENSYMDGINILSYYINDWGREYRYLPYAPDNVLVDTEYKLSGYEDHTRLVRLMWDSDKVLNYSVMYDTKVKNYKSSFKADGTKMFFEYSYKFEFVDYNSKKVCYSWEYKYATYLDTDAELNASDFKDNYITDDVLADTYYYDCDKEQVAADFMAGKDVVINPVGGADVSNYSYVYEDNRGYIYQSPYVLFIDGDKIVNGYIAGYVTDSHAKVENGKVVINSEGALDVAKDSARRMLEIEGYGSFDFENAKMYLVINDWFNMTENKCTVGRLYIPLN